MPRRFFTIMILLTIVIVAGCAPQRHDAFLHPESLKLTIAVENNTVIDQGELTVSLKLENIGNIPMRVLVRTGRSGFALRGPEALMSILHVIDHPTPNRDLWLKPGEAINWKEVIKLPPVGLGEAELSAGVPIYERGSCDKYGCDESSIESNNISLKIIQERRNGD